MFAITIHPDMVLPVLLIGVKYAIFYITEGKPNQMF